MIEPSCVFRLALFLVFLVIYCVLTSTVLNRWEHVLAELLMSDYDMGWNGTFDTSENQVPEGVYFYEYEITTKVGGSLNGHSFVHLVRD
jgi:hypothetical protein